MFETLNFEFVTQQKLTCKFKLNIRMYVPSMNDLQSLISIVPAE